jgi:hypothetical protein
MSRRNNGPQKRARLLLDKSPDPDLAQLRSQGRANGFGRSSQRSVLHELCVHRVELVMR